MIRILQGDCRDILATLPEQSIQCCVTSPPYFGLRDYGVDGQIGLEKTPDEYVSEMVAVFRDVRRVLRGDGVLWLNLGDSYASTTKGTGGASKKQIRNSGAFFAPRKFNAGSAKEKDLIGIPWMVAFALRADGWYLRSEVIWAKPNPMPESVTDRPTKAHEQVFLLSKSARYFYDAGAIAEAAETAAHHQRYAEAAKGYAKKQPGQKQSGMMGTHEDGTRNARTIWTIATQPYSGAHFATMPPDLAERCIKAGSSEKGCCPHCGAPWLRESSRGAEQPTVAPSEIDRFGTGDAGVHRKVGGQYQKWLDANPKMTTGWSPSCDCPPHEPIPCTILDPFGGAGTTALVADRLQRDAIICELNPEFAAMAKDRIEGDGGMLVRVATQ